MPAKLTAQQRRVLATLNLLDVWVADDHLGVLMVQTGTAEAIPLLDESRRTAASLVRKGYAAKTTIGDVVNYRITETGIEALK